jgi:hypothetical protein
MSYPEHEKLQAVREKSQAIGEFMQWLCDQKELHLGRWVTTDPGGTWETTSFEREHTDIQKLLAEFFEVDLDALYAEKEAMYQELRAQASVHRYYR